MNTKLIQFIISCLFIFLSTSNVLSDERKSNLEELRRRCLHYSIGESPLDPNVKSIRKGLYAQSPFSPSGEIDLAASAFSLAALPIAVNNNLISKEDAEIIALSASSRIKQMIEKSSNASSQEEIAKFGYMGMLFHYSTWNEEEGYFIGNQDTEISSIDTTLLMYGLLACAQFFQGQVMTDYEEALNLIQWNEWLDTSTNQFYMSYSASTGFSDTLWDIRTDEVMLICILAAMGDSTINVKQIWNAWRKESITYISPTSNKYTCFATWNGDPFTIFYGLIFFKFGYDFNGINWFKQSQTAYHGHVDFFKEERNYLDDMVLAFTVESQGVIAEPKVSTSEPIISTLAPIYGIAGGLEFYSNNIEANPIAQTLSSLVELDNDFFTWTGWPCESVIATDPTHPYFSQDIIGQDISATAILIDNYLTNGWLRNLIMENSKVQAVLEELFLPDNFLSWHVLQNESEALAVPSGDYAIVYGSSSDDTIIVESGARVECINFVGSNQINIQEAALDFWVYRSGATVYLSSELGTLIKIPATQTKQVLHFMDFDSELSIINNNVVMGSQPITKTLTKLNTSTIQNLK